MSKTVAAVLVAIGVAAIAGISFGSKPDTEKQKDQKNPQQLFKFLSKEELMAAKLKGTQAVLESIAMNDVKKVEQNAENLVHISNAVAFLNAYKGKEYEFHIKTFTRAATNMAAKAKNHNMDGIMVAFNDLTLSCLKCHQAIRDKQFESRLPDGADRNVVAE